MKYQRRFSLMVPAAGVRISRISNGLPCPTPADSYRKVLRNSRSVSHRPPHPFNREGNVIAALWLLAERREPFVMRKDRRHRRIGENVSAVYQDRPVGQAEAASTCRTAGHAECR